MDRNLTFGTRLKPIKNWMMANPGNESLVCRFCCPAQNKSRIESIVQSRVVFTISFSVASFPGPAQVSVAYKKLSFLCGTTLIDLQ